MERFRQILSLILLALMVPASMCCFGPDACAALVCGSCENHEHEDGKGHDHDHHAPVGCPSETISHSQVPLPIMLPSFAMAELEDVVREMLRRQGELAGELPQAEFVMTTAPPELRATWQFTQRTALPVRAPSIQA
ncbi:hypothetical protein [Prosthecobacter sp.]|uniref:hypothetical protein n=1 Tax=Prosthecobacter sp. TaxID=1965333 RepID=UPI003784E8B8